jgi:hypothetical protein
MAFEDQSVPAKLQRQEFFTKGQPANTLEKI